MPREHEGPSPEEMGIKPEELKKIQKERTLSDADLLRGGRSMMQQGVWK